MEKGIIEVLLLLNDRLQSKDISWVIYGGTALALHRLHFKIHDIDILTDKEGITSIMEELKGYVVTTNFSAKKSVCKFIINGIMIECKASTTHSPLTRQLDFITVAKHPIPVISLDNQLQAYQMCTRQKDQPKINIIKQHKKSLKRDYCEH